jgi:CO/xanthine dehydrogenase Mo-binding subunit
VASAPPATQGDGTAEQPTRRWIGKHMKRVEDPRYLVGRGGYVEDIELAGMLHAAVLNSPHAHARILSVDTSAALQVPGVVAVLTGEDCKAHMGPCANFGPPTLPQYPLAVDKTHHFGEPVAAVVAETLYAAEDGVAALHVEYEPLEPVTDPFRALADGAPLVHEEHGSNLGYEREFEFGDVDRAMADADLVLREKLHWGRSSGQPLETTGAVATVDHNGVTTIYCNSVTFSFCAFLIATALKVPSNKLRLQPVPAGGSFGSKFFAHKVPTLAGFLALRTGRPVRYVEDRLDHLSASDHHGSDRWYEVALAVDRDGTLRALDVDVVDDYGAFLQFGVGTHGNALSQVAGPYKMRDIRYHLRAAITNKCQQGAYRGFGSEVQNWILERMVDKAARELGMKPEDIRRKNFLTPDQFPYKSPTGNLYDSGNYPGVLDKALGAIDLEHWRAEKARAREEGRHIGIGIATTQERSVFSSTEFWYWFDEPTFPITSSPESATVTIDPTGEMQVTLHSQAMWGNSPETMVAMVVAEEFDVDPYSVNVTYADTSSGLPGTGPGGSRYTVMVAGAVRGASRTLKEKLCRIAAKDLETAVEDVEFVDGAARVKGAPSRSKSLPELAATAYFFALNLPEGDRSGLEEGYTYDHPYTTLPSDDRKDLGVFYPFMGHACHIAVIEIDPVTGKLEFLEYVAVHDAGTVVNPPTLAGQVIGGTAQGIGTTLLEEYVYDDQGALRTGSFWEYLVPRATDIPHMRVEHFETPSPFTEYGIKGGGEGGRMVVPSALSAAIDDVLADFGDARVTELPVKPWQIVEMMGGDA